MRTHTHARIYNFSEDHDESDTMASKTLEALVNIISYRLPVILMSSLIESTQNFLDKLVQRMPDVDVEVTRVRL